MTCYYLPGKFWISLFSLFIPALKAVSPRKSTYSPQKTQAPSSPVKSVRSSPAKLTREPSIHSPRKTVTPASVSSDDEDMQSKTEDPCPEAEQDEEMSDKENGDDASDIGMRDGMRSRLKRLGALYSGEKFCKPVLQPFVCSLHPTICINLPS